MHCGDSVLQVVNRPELADRALVVQRRGDGVLIVRVPSQERGGNRLPDAVFSFRLGDPQYSFWAAMRAELEADPG
jgi:hypothetical protein